MTPTELHIMSQHWAVRHVTDRDELLIYGGEDENEVGKNAMGLSNSGTHEITIRTAPSVSPEAERDTLLHEAIHALLAHTGLDQEMSDSRAERLICRLTPAILSLMRENPHLVSYLMEDQEDYQHDDDRP